MAIKGTELYNTIEYTNFSYSSKYSVTFSIYSFQLKVLQYLLRSLQNNVVTGNKAVASVVNSAAFAVVSVLVSSTFPKHF